MKNSGVIVYLQASLETLVERLSQILMRHKDLA